MKCLTLSGAAYARVRALQPSCELQANESVTNPPRSIPISSTALAEIKHRSLASVYTTNSLGFN